MIYRYDRHDLARFVELAWNLVQIGGKNATSLAQLCMKAKEVLARARAEPSELDDMRREIRAAISDAVAQAETTGGGTKTKAIDRAIVTSAAELVMRERAWVVPFGFEAEPTAIADIEQLLDPVN